MQNMLRLFNLLTLLFLVIACSDARTQSTMVLDYKNFGPQVIAHQLIGEAWWQWESHGAPDPKISYDIKVIVYRNIDIASVTKKFPVDAANQKDYRYLEYGQSISYLDKHINQDILPGLTKLLIETRSKIRRQLQ